MNTIKTARKDRAIFTPRGFRVRVKIPVNKVRAFKLRREIEIRLNRRGLNRGVHYKIIKAAGYNYREQDVYYASMSREYTYDLNTAIRKAVLRHNRLLG